jgi:hypothetical protein
MAEPMFIENGFDRLHDRLHGQAGGDNLFLGQQPHADGVHSTILRFKPSPVADLRRGAI